MLELLIQLPKLFVLLISQQATPTILVELITRTTNVVEIVLQTIGTADHNCITLISISIDKWFSKYMS